MLWPAHATVIGQFPLSSFNNNEIADKYKGVIDWKIFYENRLKNLDELLIKVEKASHSKSLINSQQFKNTMLACAASH